MTEPTTQTLVELVASALDAQTQYSLQPNLHRIDVAQKARQALLDALEAQAREIERLEALHVTTMMDELQPALEERNTLRAELAAIRAVPVVNAGLVELPKEDTEEANKAITSMLAEYQYPANPQNAGRAGWRAARLYTARTQQAQKGGE